MSFELWNVLALKEVPPGIGLLSDKGVYFIRTTDAWMEGHPSVNTSSWKSKPYGRMKLLTRKETIEALVKIATVNPNNVVIRVPTKSRKGATDIGRFLQSAKGQKTLRARLKRLGQNKEPSDEMDLGPSNAYVIIDLKSQGSTVNPFGRSAAIRVARAYIDKHPRMKLALKQRHLIKMLQKGGTFGVVSPYGSAASGMSKKESKMRHGMMVGALQKMGYTKWETLKASPWEEGAYRERSLLIPGIRATDLFKLGKQFKQDAVIYKSRDGVIGMYYYDGYAYVAANVEGEPQFEIADDMSLYSKDRNWSFEFGFAWGDKIPWDGRTPLSKADVISHFQSEAA